MPWAWLVAALCLVGFILCLGSSISNNLFGILINEQNLMSLSRFQTALWTIIVGSAFLVIAAARVRDGVQQGDALNIQLDPQLLSLLGITVATLVGSPLIDATKKSKDPAPSVVQQTADTLVKTGNTPASVAPGDPLAPVITNHAQGILYKNPQPSDASFADMFEGAEVGNAAQLDLAKVQMFFITLIVAIGYVCSLVAIMGQGNMYEASFSFPTLSAGMVALLGISNGGYLGNKAVDHTKT